MGTRTRPVWLSVTLILLAMMRKMEAAEEAELQGSTFCQNQVLTKEYDCEEHKIYSEDGFMLVMHRVWAKKPATISKTIHLEMAGLPVLKPSGSSYPTSLQGNPGTFHEQTSPSGGNEKPTGSLSDSLPSTPLLSTSQFGSSSFGGSPSSSSRPKSVNAQNPAAESEAIGATPRASVFTPQSIQTPTGGFSGSPLSSLGPTSSTFGKMPTSTASAQSPGSRVNGIMPTASNLTPQSFAHSPTVGLTPSTGESKPLSFPGPTSTQTSTTGILGGVPSSTSGTVTPAQNPTSESVGGSSIPTPTPATTLTGASFGFDEETPSGTKAGPASTHSPGSGPVEFGIAPMASLVTPQSSQIVSPSSSPTSAKNPTNLGSSHSFSPTSDATLTSSSSEGSPSSTSSGPASVESPGSATGSLSNPGSAPSRSLEGSPSSSRTPKLAQTPSLSEAHSSNPASAQSPGSSRFAVSGPGPQTFSQSPTGSGDSPFPSPTSEPTQTNFGGSQPTSSKSKPLNSSTSGSAAARSFGSPGRSESSRQTSPVDDALVSAADTALGALQGKLDDLRRKLRREAVLLMHQELLNGDSWFKHVELEGEDALLPLTLADQGYEVWIGHERATLWSHDHLTLKAQDQAYWNWTWDQHAQFDVPAMLNYVCDQTKNKVHYIGVSQSATVGVAAATRPEVANLMKSLTLIGPIIYRGSATPLLMHSWAQFFGHIDISNMAATNRHPDSGSFDFSREFHLKSLSLAEPSSQLHYAVSGPDCCLGSTVFSFENRWDGITSYKNVRHFEQGIMTNTFQHFDYGSATRNAEAYNGRTTAPVYDPKDIPANLPVMVVYGGQDFYSPPDGVLEFLSMTQTRPHTVYLPMYAHFDLSFSRKRGKDVYGPIQDFLRSQ